jgi:hypothetical protein
MRSSSHPEINCTILPNSPGTGTRMFSYCKVGLRRREKGRRKIGRVPQRPRVRLSLRKAACCSPTPTRVYRKSGGSPTIASLHSANLDSSGNDLVHYLFWRGDVTLLWCLGRRNHRSPFSPSQPIQEARLQNRSNRIARVRSDYRRKGNYMAVTDSLTLERLRREENLAEQQGRQALNISKILKNHPQYDAARQKADALLAKASALREQIVKIETD